MRATYASCLASLATTALRFLDMMQALRVGGSLPASDPEADDGIITQSINQQLYDVAREDLVIQFEQQTKAFLTDNDPAVRRAFLGSVAPLCVFFGSTRASDVMLSHLNTYLNENDWQLKCAFLETIIGVATYVGPSSFEEFILPLMIQALTDPEESVVERVLRSFSAIANLGLFQRSKIWELIDIVSRFLIHPNIWVREASAEFLAAATTYLSPADCHSMVVPLVKTYFKVLPSNLTEPSILDDLKRPLPRLVFDMALTWASKVEKGIFWKHGQRQQRLSFGSAGDKAPSISAKDFTAKAFTRIPKNEEDESWLQKLRAAGMSEGDEFKLLVLRDYIWRVAQRKSQDGDANQESEMEFNHVLALKDLQISPQTVFFDSDQDLFRYALSRQEPESGPRTISEALQDASNTETESEQAQGGLHAAHGQSAPPQRRKQQQIETPMSSAQDLDALQVAIGKGEEFALPTKTRSRDSEVVDSNLTRLTDQYNPLRRRGSAMSLVGRADSANKAAAAIQTTTANAFGKIEGTFAHAGSKGRRSPLAAPPVEYKAPPPPTKEHPVHSYLGHDPSVLKLLGTLYMENYPMDMIEFGPLIAPSKRLPIHRVFGQQPGQLWRPEGTLVAMLGEHTAAVTRIIVAPDQAFFLSASDDGTVKVWDTARLERNVTHRSRLTYRHAHGVKVTSLTFIENTHCFISTGSDGSIHVVKVDHTESHGSVRYGKLKVLREYQLPREDEQYVVWSEHYKFDSQSVLLVATNRSRVLAIDLRRMSVLYTLSNPVYHGTPTCFCLDKRHHWLLLGTTHGVIDLWDLRFRIRLKSWAFSGGSAINRICLSPGRSSRKNRVTIAGGTGTGELTTWDLEKGSIREVFRTGLVQPGSDGKAKEQQSTTVKIPRLIDLDEDKMGGILSRFGSQGEGGIGEAASGSTASASGIKSVVIGAHYLEDGSDPRHFFAITAGPDWKVRFWDSSRVDASCVVNGLALDEGRPTYQLSHPSQDLTIVSETLHPAPEAARPDAPSRAGSTVVSASTKVDKSGGKKESTGVKGQRSSIISLQQQNLMKKHLDAVEDVALLESPYGMVVSCDREGLIYIFS